MKDNEAIIRGINAAATRVPTTICDGPSAEGVPISSLSETSQDNSGARPTDPMPAMPAMPLTIQGSVIASPNISKCELMWGLCAWCITCVFASRIRAFSMHTSVSVVSRAIDGNTCAAACRKRLYSSTGDLYAPSAAPVGGAVLRNQGRMHCAHESGAALEPSQARAAAVGGQGIARSCGQGTQEAVMLSQMRELTPAAAQEGTRASARDWMGKQVLDIVGLLNDSSATDLALGLPPRPVSSCLHCLSLFLCLARARELYQRFVNRRS